MDGSAFEQRGTLVQAEPLVTLSREVTDAVGGATRAVYRSISAATGQGTEVSGTFFVPKGRPPGGGWPVIAFAHGTTGLTIDCGPSLHADLLGYGQSVKFLTGAGYAVAFTDYEGLGHPGRHPYLDSRTAGFNVIDSVRALREQFPDVSPRWAALGGSQGGQAAWAANEYAVDYGAGLNLVGSLAMAPAADVSALAIGARNGTLTVDQVAVMLLVIQGLENTNPDLAESDYLRGAAASGKDTVLSCSSTPDEKSAVYRSLRAEQVRPASASATAHLGDLLRAQALPQRTLTAPMLVVNGGLDPLIAPLWVSEAVSRSCAMRGIIEHVVIPGRGHTDLQFDDQAFQWLVDRFTATPAPSNCANG